VKRRGLAIMASQEVDDMRTNLVLDDTLLDQARHLSGLRSTRETVDAALREFVARRQQQEILKLVGQDLIDPAYDVRAVRAAMNDGDGSR
jgi:Arc/MetJ family transcription regulator